MTTTYVANRGATGLQRHAQPRTEEAKKAEETKEAKEKGA